MADKKQFMYRITFKKHFFESNTDMKIDRILCEEKSLFKMMESIIVHYPESVEDGNYIKVEGVVI